MAQGIMAEKFLMPSLNNISKYYNLSASVTGILCAFGLAVPELSVTLLSFTKHGIKMTEFGVGTIFGSVVFCVTFVPAFAYFVVYGITKERPELTETEIQQNVRLRKIFIREMFFIIVGIGLFYLIMDNFSITLFEASMFLVLFVVYLIVVFVQNSYSQRQDAKE